MPENCDPRLVDPLGNDKGEKVYSLADHRPRWMPMVEVELINEMNVKIHHELNQVDIMRTIFEKGGMTTLSQEEFNSLNSGTVAPKVSSGMGDVPSPKNRKWLIKKGNNGEAGYTSLVTLGPNMILRPIINKVAADVVKGMDVKTYNNEVKEENGAYKTTGISVDRSKMADAGVYTDTTDAFNSWIPDKDYEGYYSEDGPMDSRDGRIFKNYIGEEVWGGISSAFKLRKNQPFCISLKMYSPSPLIRKAQEEFWNTDKAKKWELYPIIPDNLRQDTCTVITWGGDSTKDRFLLVVYRNKNVALFKQDGETNGIPNWKSIGETTLNTEKDLEHDGLDLVIYPLQSHLFLFDAAKIPSSPTGIKCSSFVLSEPIQLEESVIRVINYGGRSVFGFYPVLHEANGSIQCPDLFVPWKQGKNNGTTICVSAKVDYVGNVGVDSDICRFTEDGLKQATNSEYAKKHRLNTNGNTFIVFPHHLDKKKLYSYLGGGYVSIGIQLNNDPNDKQQSYYVNIVSGDSGTGTFVRNRIYSPAIRSVSLQVVPGMQKVSMEVNPKILSKDILSVNIRNGVQGSTATITLNNRKSSEERGVPNYGRYTWYPGYKTQPDGKLSTFTGVKPVKIKCGWIGETLQFGVDCKKELSGNVSSVPKFMMQHFHGFITKRTYNRPNPESSTVELSCEDRSKQLKESYAVMLPIYDGWCALAVMHHLAKFAGFTDDEILLDEDFYHEGTKKRLVDLIVGDPDSKTGPCYEGHVDGFMGDQNVGNVEFGKVSAHMLKGQYLHMTLPTTILTEEPAYMFQFGKPIWDCMEEVRKHSGYYTFCNHYGNFVYGPPPLVVQKGKQTMMGRGGGGRLTVKSHDAMKFVEVDLVEKYNEFQRNLTGSYDTTDMRNALILQGIYQHMTHDNIPTWDAFSITKKQPAWPNNPDDPAYYPYIRWMFLRNPRWNDQKRATLMAEEIFRRVQRNKAMANFSAWGQPEIYPFIIFEIDEKQARETGLDSAMGVDCSFYIATEVSHNIEPQKWTTDISAEIFDERAINFEPNLW